MEDQVLTKLINNTPSVLVHLIKEYIYDYWEIGYIGDIQLSKRTMDVNQTMLGASRGGHIDIVNLMIKKGGNDWNRCMVAAARGGYLDIIQLMILHIDKIDYSLV
jgi:hypothetical protein